MPCSERLKSDNFAVGSLVFDGQDIVSLLLGRFAAPSRIRRNWMLFAVATPAVLASMTYMYRNRCAQHTSRAESKGPSRAIPCLLPRGFNMQSATTNPDDVHDNNT